ncbi:MAG: ubiquinol oxidase subunit II [Gammaproteobacteria bacterium]
MKKIKFLLCSLLALSLSGCKYALLDPQGIVASAEKQLIIISTVLMLLIVVPVIIMVIYISHKYRATNVKAKYTPNWAHSTRLELLWWAIPCIIVAILAVITWITSHTLDPYRPLDVEASKKPLTVEVVAMNWKWLFIYPEQNIAVVNFLEIPKQVPINFKITSDAPMNSFWIPQLGGQIYAMPGMRTKLHLMADHEGLYDGWSASFSGDGFSGMHFKVKTVSPTEFNQWVTKAKSSNATLSRDAYTLLAKNSENNPITYYSSVKKGLFNDVIMKYMMPPQEMQHNKE